MIGRPYGRHWNAMLCECIRTAAETGENQLPQVSREDAEIVVIGEGVSSLSLAAAVGLDTGIPVRVIAATEFEPRMLGASDRIARDEDELLPLLDSAKIIIADPLYAPICPKTAKCIRLPHEGFSGRIFREEIPDMTEDISYITEQL